MPFFQVDDQLAMNHKFRRLDEIDLEEDGWRGQAAQALWVKAGAHSQNVGTDGAIRRLDLITLAPQQAVECAELLVEVGLWHRPGHDCEQCPPLPDGVAYLFHDWFQMRYTPAKDVRTNRRKRKELLTPQLVAQVWARDCVDPENPTTGKCRYCGKLLKHQDRRSPTNMPTIDHVNPRKASGIRNLVLACKSCNQSKGNRTPKDAGMTLRPPPRPEPSEIDDHVAATPPAVSMGHESEPARPGSSRTGQEFSAPITPPPAPVGDEPEPATPGSSRSRQEFSAPTDPGHDEGDQPRPVSVGDESEPARPGSSRTGQEFSAPNPPQVSGRLNPRSSIPDVRRVDTTTPGDAPTAQSPPDQSGNQTQNQADNHRRNHTETLSTRGRAPGQGQGLGVGRGLGKGERSPDHTPALPDPGGPAVSGPGSPRRRRRGRRRRSPAPPSLPVAEVLDAGAPPPGDHGPAGGFGSPYYGWHGPPSPVVETLCPIHQQPSPCWKCEREQESE